MKVTTTTVVDDGQPAAKATWDGETITVGGLAKSEPELRYTLNVIYPADKADIGKALDGHRDFASREVVQKAAWDYMRNHRAVGMCHTPEQAAAAGVELLQQGAAELVESYIYQGPDWEPVEGFAIKAGDWLGGFIWSPGAWGAIKDGRLGGVSVEGKARRRKPSAEAVAGLRN
jgi:hypothetical protein